MVLSIFKLFETQRKVSIGSLSRRWAADADVVSLSALDAIKSLEPAQVLRTCLMFPDNVHLDANPSEEDLEGSTDSAEALKIYDPIFLILLFSSMLSEAPPDSGVAWVEVLRTNITSLLLRALSAKDGFVRELALCQIAGLWSSLRVSLGSISLSTSELSSCTGRRNARTRPCGLYPRPA